MMRLGVCCLRESPNPSCPSEPSPQLYTSPPEVSARLCFSPQETSITPSLCIALTTVGIVWI